MHPRAWRAREKVPIELRYMLDEIYAIDHVLSYSFSSFAINKADVSGYWDLNSQHSVTSFFNGIPYADFPDYVVKKATKIESVCDTIVRSSSDGCLIKDINVCKDVCGIMMHTIITCWISYYPITAFGNEHNKDYFIVSSWRDYDWSKCPAYCFAKWLNRTNDLVSDAERCKSLFIDKLDCCLECFFPEYYPNEHIRVLFAYDEGNCGLDYIIYDDLIKVMKAKPGKEKRIKSKLKYIDSSKKDYPYPVARNKKTEGSIPVINSSDLFHLIQFEYLR